MNYQDRKYQDDLEADVFREWNGGAKNVLMRLDTGGGKTFILSRIIKKHQGASCVMAHRSELVGQLSLALARQGIRHNIIAAEKTRRNCVQEHVLELGVSFYTPGAPCAVSSVDTLIRAQGLESWFSQVTLWVCDEAHHLVNDNKWHTCVENFKHPLCRGLGPTATPKRADGKGLGAHADGVFNVMVEGPPMRWLIEQGFLTDYRIICPTSDMLMLEDVGASGDWSTKALREAAKRSHIVGDVVKSYLQWGKGKLGITFSTDVETAADITRAYQAAGVRAETLTGETDPGFRRQMLKSFAARQLDQIVAVDIISEGFDLPAIEVASFARPTQSLALYMQQFGRALRPLPGKDRAVILDHVGNTVRHQGPPDKPRVWSLDRRDRKSSGAGDAIPLRVCVNAECLEPFERFYVKCPHCGQRVPEPTARSSPAAVEGDMIELDPEVLARLRGDLDRANMADDVFLFDQLDRNVPAAGRQRQLTHHRERREAQLQFRPVMMAWLGRRLVEGRTIQETQRYFWLQFNIDVVSAQGLGPDDTLALKAKVEAKL